MVPEILAPAGSMESLKAAIRCGANAVYLGGMAFNARRNADNFDLNGIKEAVDYCHKHGAKVHITLNTLIADRELKDACDEIRGVCEAGADAFIIQDIGIARLVHEICPEIALHASTQTSVQSIYGIEELKKIGFSRVVLPRELSAKEIKNISENTDIELEYFVHGALCMCLSGQCLMSSVLGGRSGNRGLCAQPCRLPFGINEKGGNNLSLKDLSLIDRIDELTDAGIVSLKIEGRMKRPEYVAAAVTACKNAVNHTPDKKLSNSLDAVFSRSGHTSGYFDSKLGKDMFGIRTKDNVQSTAEVISDLSHLYDNENPLLPVSVNFRLKSNEFPSLEISCGNKSVTINGEIKPAPAMNKEISETDAADRLSKLGGTQFYAENIKCEIDRGLNLPVSAINALRRNAVSALENAISYKKDYIINKVDPETNHHLSAGRKLYVRFGEIDQITDSVIADRIIIPIDTPDETIKKLSDKAQIAVEIPVNVFSDTEKFRNRLIELKKLGVNLAECDNLDGVGLAKSVSMPFATFFGMNIFNSYALDFFEKDGAVDCLISSECAPESFSKLRGTIPRGALAYGRLPLMVTRNCPIKNKLSCKECNRKSEIVDRMGIHFPVRCHYSCSYIYNSRPVSMTDRLSEFRNSDFDLLYFTTETDDECQKILDDYKFGKAPDYEYTRGLYQRTVL